MKSFLSYLGGKSQLTKKIIPLIPEHTCYCEVFAGASWMFFGKEESKVEIINDVNSELITLFRVVQNHLEEFIRHLKWILTARDEFDRFKKQPAETLTDIQRAIRFFFLLKNSYGSRLTNPSFNVSTTTRPKINLLRIEEQLSEAHIRLARVTIENKPYKEVIKRFDRPHTFFYVDPPYYNCEKDYGKNIFSKADFEVLKECLTGIKGTFIMSINDVPEIKQAFADFHIKPVTTNYSIGQTKKVKELLISNFPMR